MTIAIALKVVDGLVLAADSASTLIMSEGGTAAVANVYNNADKIVNLRKGSPIGVVFWGAGGIGASSLTTLAKDLRTRFTEGGNDWLIDPTSYRMEQVAQRVKAFFIDERYEAVFGDGDDRPELGMFVVGYSSGEEMSECWEVGVGSDGAAFGPTRVLSVPDTGMLWRGEPEAITRLIMGFGSGMVGALNSMGVTDPDAIEQALGVLRAHLEVTLVHPAMPIQDAIDLGASLVELTKHWSRFIPGAPTVGGPTEVAAITKHEGFKWIQRKHYYDQRLNPVQGP